MSVGSREGRRGARRRVGHGPTIHNTTGTKSCVGHAPIAQAEQCQHGRGMTMRVLAAAVVCLLCLSLERVGATEELGTYGDIIEK